MEVLTTDITYLPFGHSMLYLSSIMDIYNREIVAYKIDDKQDQSLVNDIFNQIDIPERCILHNNQGSVYTSYAYYQLCEEKGIIRSLIHLLHSFLITEESTPKSLFRWFYLPIIIRITLRFFNELILFC